MAGGRGGSALLKSAGRWEVRGSRTLGGEVQYLCLERVAVAVGEDSRGEGIGEGSTGVELWEVEESDDDEEALAGPTTLQPPASRDSGTGVVHLYDFHVVHNPSYQVPEVFFFGRCGRDGRVLNFEEVARDFSLHAPYSQEDLSSVFVPKEHPLLLLPWYGTHLCETPGLLRAMLAPREGGCGLHLEPELRYMVSWWSAIGKHFGLGLPLELVKDSLASQQDVVREKSVTRAERADINP
ncbi:Atg3 active-site domain domain-containing protein [Chloropicon primus]|nr:Atg3 active-site domain domain-containing protein [Chloropicon primus]